MIASDSAQPVNFGSGARHNQGGDLPNLRIIALTSLLTASLSCAADDKPFDAAGAFGALPTVRDLRLSADGRRPKRFLYFTHLRPRLGAAFDGFGDGQQTTAAAHRKW
jgi:hypothetical protein